MSQSKTGKKKKTEKAVVNAYRVERGVFLEALFEYCWLLFRQPQLLPRCLAAVFLVADPSRTSSVDLVLLADRISLAPLPAHAREGAVRRRNAGFFLAVGCCWRHPIHIDAFEERPRLTSEDLTTPLCIDLEKKRIWVRKIRRFLIRLEICHIRWIKKR